MIKYTIAFLITLLFHLQLLAADNQQGTITLNFDQLKSDNGLIVVKLYDTSSLKFPKTESAISIKKSNIEKNKATISFENLLFGIYAYTVYHDENNNGVMDSNLIHIPTEGAAFSNNPKIWFGPPSFEKASFKLDKEHLYIKVKLKY